VYTPFKSRKLKAYWAVDEQEPVAVHVTVGPGVEVYEGILGTSDTEEQSASCDVPSASVSAVATQPVAPTKSIRNSPNSETYPGILRVTATTSK